eukprot:TRINITY_DN53941_c0_g1_i1.p1 TRINITY_DN53941_c0_g1~~TRINITY_DN53941_c0_g1_i1.p1  ORF type:complete len:610 (-),score=355.31 TRINITY_DN53941_c0_g1_i1:1145-2974(-)
MSSSDSGHGEDDGAEQQQQQQRRRDSSFQSEDDESSGDNYNHHDDDQQEEEHQEEQHADDEKRGGDDDDFEIVRVSRPGDIVPQPSEVERALSSRGLTFIKRKPTEDENGAPLDPKTEHTLTDAFTDMLAKRKFKYSVTRPFDLSPPDATGTEAMRYHVFFFAVYKMADLPECSMLHVDTSRKVVVFFDTEGLPLMEKSVIGSKVSADLVSKSKLHVWFHKDVKPYEIALYDEDYRDHVVDVLKLREKPAFDIVCIHEAQVFKRTGTFSWEPRFVRCVNGQCLVYMSENDQWPKEVMSIAGVAVTKKSSNSFKLRSPQRKLVLKSKTHGVEFWLEVTQMTQSRCARERTLTTQHIDQIRQKAIKRKWARRTLPKGFDIRRASAAAASTLERGYSVNRMNQHGDPAAASSRSLYSRSGRSSPTHSAHSAHSAKTAPPVGVSATVGNHLHANPNSRRLHMSREDMHHKQVRGASVGNSEIEVRVVAGKKEVPIGFVELIDLRMMLSEFRQQIMSELDNVPPDFVFLRDSVPVGTRQEAKKGIEYILSQSIVRIRMKLGTRSSPASPALSSSSSTHSLRRGGSGGSVGSNRGGSPVHRASKRSGKRRTGRRK